MNINSIHTNVRNNTIIETIKNVTVNNDYATVEVESVEFDGMMTIVDSFFAEIPVIVVK